MSALDLIKSNLNVAKTLILDGRDRYIGVTRTALNIEQIYRNYRTRAKVLSSSEAEKLLRQAHRDSAEQICALCRDNGAIWVKFAQFLSCRPDLLPLEYISALQRLQNDAAPARFEDIHPIILANWGQDWDKQFSRFDVLPIATASVAQVHRATLLDGREVAIKFQLPTARSLFEQDSLVFTTLAKALRPLIREFDIKQVIQQLIAMTLEELDFRREAVNLKTFRTQTHLPGIIMPELFESLSSERVMVTSWVEGVRLSEYLSQHPERAKPLLQRLLASYLQQITQLGIYHADPHPGNFLITADEQIAILDYGAIAHLSPEQRLQYTNLLMGLMGFSTVKLGDLFKQAGFRCERPETLEEISDYVVGDNLEGLSIADRLSDSLDKLRKNKVIMPDSFVAMARVIITIGGFMTHYDVDFEFDPASVAA
ncbi:ABC1 kinase family protein [Ketobacter sp.]|uniref:ABC1 kinase family protein n=1 Tax=Ketobacter sp. TaxID=2083498 RepID=UPI000F20956C|nr:AarF/UbiB family protein [Ketobacter sp.]RLT97434.1 MAG: AarF/ABC1/UbiB kinase family protein [Ketobacter sp.]